MINKILALLLLVSFTHADKIDDKLAKARQEIKNLKRELDEYYVKKEIDFATKLKEQKLVLQKIERDKKEMQKLRKEMSDLLKAIKNQTKSKALKIYSKMKLKKLATILKKMYNNGKEKEVYDILVQLSETKTAKLFEMFDPSMSITLLDRISNPKSKRLEAMKKNLEKQK